MPLQKHAHSLNNLCVGKYFVVFILSEFLSSSIFLYSLKNMSNFFIVFFVFLANSDTI